MDAHDGGGRHAEDAAHEGGDRDELSEQPRRSTVKVDRSIFSIKRGVLAI